MSFVLDGAEWRFDGWTPEQIDEKLGALLDRADVARSRRERVWVGDDLQSRHVRGTSSIWDLWGPESPVALPPELRQELAAMLAGAQRYLDEEDWPEGMDHLEVRIDGEHATENADVAWAHHHVRAGRAFSLLGLERAGVFQTESAAGIATVHWIVDEAGQRAFWRAAIDVERDTPACLERLAPHAFPDLHFLAGVWRGLHDFSGGYNAIRELLRKVLAVLDDHGRWAFTTPPPALSPNDESDRTGTPSNQIVQRRFSSFGADLAPEHEDVRSDLTCRRARERTVGERVLYCEWHAKLQPHQNRVHLHPPVPESSGRLVVAIFHEHLPLP